MRRLAALACTLAPLVAAANGRAPLTNGIYVSPTDVHALYVRTTFGLLVSHDDGCTLRWVCEKAIGYGGEFDPKYAIASDGTIFATTFTGLRVSRDAGCTWATSTSERADGDPGKIADIWIDAIDIGATGEVWVATAESAKPNNVYRSIDNGMTFEPKGLASPTVWYKSIKVAHSDPQRIYATGYQVAGTAQAHLYRSDTDGSAWNELPLTMPPFQYGATPIVLVVAVDPVDPDILFVTSIGANPPNGDRLYRSANGGTSFTEVLATTDPIRDVVIAGGHVRVATPSSGSYESTDGVSFVAMGSATAGAKVPQLDCLAARADGSLVGCGTNWTPDFMAVGTSGDGGTWQKLFRFVELAGPLECAAGTTEAEMCAPQWPALQAQFGATGPQTCNGAPDGPSVDGPPVKKPAGCCDAGEGAPAGLVVLVGAIVVASRRRRRHGH